MVSMQETPVREPPMGVGQADDRVLIVSSDGHASAEMPDFMPYIPSSHLEEFAAFCELYKEKGTRSFEAGNMLKRTDDTEVDKWVRNVIDTERVRGSSDPMRRFVE